MPQMGDLLQGFLFRKKEYEREEEAEEEKKRQKLEDQLRGLNFTALQRKMEEDTKEFEYQQRKRQELDEAFKNLELQGIDVDALRTGYKPEEPAYPWMGTPYEEAGARKEFYIRPTELKKETKPKRMTSASYRAQASSLESQAEQSTSVAEIKGLRAKAKKLREQANELFKQEQRDRGMIPPAPPLNPLLDVTKLIEERNAISPLTPPALEGTTGVTVELPPALIGELKNFETFEDWYDNLPEDAQAELDTEPETLKAIKNWYVIPR